MMAKKRKRYQRLPLSLTRMIWLLEGDCPWRGEFRFSRGVLVVLVFLVMQICVRLVPFALETV
jgi:hypothetical protein